MQGVVRRSIHSMGFPCFIFFSKTHECAYHSIEKKGKDIPSVYSVCYTVTSDHIRVHPKGNYSSTAHLASLANNPSRSPLNSPACLQILPSLSNCRMTREAEGTAPSKMIAFRCFQMTHMPNRHNARIVRRFSARCSCLTHQEPKVSSALGSNSGRPVVTLIPCHTSFESVQFTMR